MGYDYGSTENWAKAQQQRMQQPSAAVFAEQKVRGTAMGPSLDDIKEKIAALHVGELGRAATPPAPPSDSVSAALEGAMNALDGLRAVLATLCQRLTVVTDDQPKNVTGGTGETEPAYSCSLARSIYQLEREVRIIETAIREQIQYLRL